MSYCRMGDDSDVYVYRTSMGWTMHGPDGSHAFRWRWEVVAKGMELKYRGYMVPARMFDRLIGELEELEEKLTPEDRRADFQYRNDFHDRRDAFLRSWLYRTPNFIMNRAYHRQVDLSSLTGEPRSRWWPLFAVLYKVGLWTQSWVTWYFHVRPDEKRRIKERDRAAI